MMRVSFALNGPPSLRAVRSLLSSGEAVQARCIADVEESDLGAVLREISQHHVDGLDVGVAEDVPFNRNVPKQPRHKGTNGETISDVILKHLRKSSKGLSLKALQDAIVKAGFSKGSGSSNIDKLLRDKQIKRDKPAHYVVVR